VATPSVPGLELAGWWTGTDCESIDSAFPVCSHSAMDELSFKIVKIYDARDEVIVRSSNFLICKAAFEKALFVYPNDHLEMRQGARILLKSKEDEPGS
jgi:hypothetical protein